MKVLALGLTRGTIRLLRENGISVDTDVERARENLVKLLGARSSNAAVLDIGMNKLCGIRSHNFGDAPATVVELKNEKVVLTVNLTAMDVRLNGIRVDLRGNQLRLICRLATPVGHVVPMEQLREAVMGMWTRETLIVAICRLRKKLGDASIFIQNVPGIGYRLSDEEPK